MKAFIGPVPDKYTQRTEYEYPILHLLHEEQRQNILIYLQKAFFLTQIFLAADVNSSPVKLI